MKKIITVPRWEFRALEEGQTLEIVLYGEIGNSLTGSGITAKAVMDQLQAYPAATAINLYLNSNGGAVSDGLAIYNALARHPATVNVNIDGFALSIASVIAMAGDTIRMAENGFLMIHDPLEVVVGNAEQLRQAADVLDKAGEQLANTYAARAEQPIEKMRELMKAETWFTADEALEIGLIDEVVAAKKMAACAFNLDRFPKAPKAAKALVRRSQVKEVPMPDVSIPSSPPVAVASPAPEPANRPATLGELRAALDGASAEFILAQLEAGADVALAIRRQNLLLRDELKVAKAQPPVEPRKPIPAGPGLGGGKHDRLGESPDDMEAFAARDFMAAAQAYQVEKGITSRTQAMSALAVRYPEAHREWMNNQPQVKTGSSVARFARIN